MRTNATLMFNPAQALLAGLAGSPYISPFIGRARMVGGDGIAEIAQMRKLFDAWGIAKTLIIGASIKDVTQAIDVIIAGADCVAVPFAVFMAMMEHPLTEQGYEHFAAELAKVRSRG
jgi:transaldolase